LENKSCEEQLKWVVLFTIGIKTPGEWLHCGFQPQGRWPAVLSPLHPKQKKAGLNFYKETYKEPPDQQGRLQNLIHSSVWNNSGTAYLDTHGGSTLDDLTFLLVPKFWNSAIGWQTSSGLSTLCLERRRMYMARVTHSPQGFLPGISTSGKAFLSCHTSKSADAQII
jgi:hypothetical protein